MNQNERIDRKQEEFKESRLEPEKLDTMSREEASREVQLYLFDVDQLQDRTEALPDSNDDVVLDPVADFLEEVALEDYVVMCEDFEELLIAQFRVLLDMEDEFEIEREGEVDTVPPLALFTDDEIWEQETLEIPEEYQEFFDGVYEIVEVGDQTVVSLIDSLDIEAPYEENEQVVFVECVFARQQYAMAYEEVNMFLMDNLDSLSMDDFQVVSSYMDMLKERALYTQEIQSGLVLVKVAQEYEEYFDIDPYSLSLIYKEEFFGLPEDEQGRLMDLVGEELDFSQDLLQINVEMCPYYEIMFHTGRQMMAQGNMSGAKDAFLNYLSTVPDSVVEGQQMNIEVAEATLGQIGLIELSRVHGYMRQIDETMVLSMQGSLTRKRKMNVAAILVENYVEEMEEILGVMMGWLESGEVLTVEQARERLAIEGQRNDHGVIGDELRVIQLGRAFADHLEGGVLDVFELYDALEGNDDPEVHRRILLEKARHYRDNGLYELAELLFDEYFTEDYDSLMESRPDFTREHFARSCENDPEFLEELDKRVEEIVGESDDEILASQRRAWEESHPGEPFSEQAALAQIEEMFSQQKEQIKQDMITSEWETALKIEMCSFMEGRNRGDVWDGEFNEMMEFDAKGWQLWKFTDEEWDGFLKTLAIDVALMMVSFGAASAVEKQFAKSVFSKVLVKELSKEMSEQAAKKMVANVARQGGKEALKELLEEVVERGGRRMAITTMTGLVGFALENTAFVTVHGALHGLHTGDFHAFTSWHAFKTEWLMSAMTLGTLKGVGAVYGRTLGQVGRGVERGALGSATVDAAHLIGSNLSQIAALTGTGYLGQVVIMGEEMSGYQMAAIVRQNVAITVAFTAINGSAGKVKKPFKKYEPTSREVVADVMKTVYPHGVIGRGGPRVELGIARRARDVVSEVGDRFKKILEPVQGLLGRLVVEEGGYVFVGEKRVESVGDFQNLKGVLDGAVTKMKEVFGIARTPGERTLWNRTAERLNQWGLDISGAWGGRRAKAVADRLEGLSTEGMTAGELRARMADAVDARARIEGLDGLSPEVEAARAKTEARLDAQEIRFGEALKAELARIPERIAESPVTRMSDSRMKRIIIDRDVDAARSYLQDVRAMLRDIDYLPAEQRAQFEGLRQDYIQQIASMERIIQWKAYEADLMREFYPNGIERSVPVQGPVNNCWLISSLRVARHRHPALLREAIARAVRRVSDGWEVTFPGDPNGQPVKVTERMIREWQDRHGGLSGDRGDIILEVAYEYYVSRRRGLEPNSASSRPASDFGMPQRALFDLLGVRVVKKRLGQGFNSFRKEGLEQSVSNFLENKFSRNPHQYMVVAGSRPMQRQFVVVEGQRIYSSHAYSLLEYSPARKTVTLVDPNVGVPFELSMRAFNRQFGSLTHAKVNPLGEVLSQLSLVSSPRIISDFLSDVLAGGDIYSICGLNPGDMAYLGSYLCSFVHYHSGNPVLAQILHARLQYLAAKEGVFMAPMEQRSQGRAADRGFDPNRPRPSIAEGGDKPKNRVSEEQLGEILDRMGFEEITADTTTRQRNGLNLGEASGSLPEAPLREGGVEVVELMRESRRIAKEIREEFPDMPREERNNLVREATYRLVREQMEVVGEVLGSMEAYIRKNPDASYAEIVDECFPAAVKEKLPVSLRRKVQEGILSYLKKRSALLESTAGIMPAEFVETIFGFVPEVEVRMFRCPMSVYVDFANPADYVRATNRNLALESDPQVIKEMADKERSGGMAFPQCPNRNYPGLDGVITIGNQSLRRGGFETVLVHEEGHQINGLMRKIMGVSEGAKIRSESDYAYSRYKAQEALPAEHYPEITRAMMGMTEATLPYPKDEILAYLRDGRSPESIVEILGEPAHVAEMTYGKGERPLYDYLGKKRDAFERNLGEDKGYWFYEEYINCYSSLMKSYTYLADVLVKSVPEGPQRIAMINRLAAEPIRHWPKLWAKEWQQVVREHVLPEAKRRIKEESDMALFSNNPDRHRLTALMSEARFYREHFGLEATDLISSREVADHFLTSCSHDFSGRGYFIENLRIAVESGLMTRAQVRECITLIRDGDFFVEHYSGDWIGAIGEPNAKYATRTEALADFERKIEAFEYTVEDVFVETANAETVLPGQRLSLLAEDGSVMVDGIIYSVEGDNVSFYGVYSEVSGERMMYEMGISDAVEVRRRENPVPEGYDARKAMARSAVEADRVDSKDKVVSEPVQRDRSSGPARKDKGAVDKDSGVEDLANKPRGRIAAETLEAFPERRGRVAAETLEAFPDKAAETLEAFPKDKGDTSRRESERIDKSRDRVAETVEILPEPYVSESPSLTSHSVDAFRRAAEGILSRTEVDGLIAGVEAERAGYSGEGGFRTSAADILRNYAQDISVEISVPDGSGGSKNVQCTFTGTYRVRLGSLVFGARDASGNPYWFTVREGGRWSYYEKPIPSADPVEARVSVPEWYRSLEPTLSLLDAAYMYANGRIPLSMEGRSRLFESDLAFDSVAEVERIRKMGEGPEKDQAKEFFRNDLEAQLDAMAPMPDLLRKYVAENPNAAPVEVVDYLLAESFGAQRLSISQIAVIEARVVEYVNKSKKSAEVLEQYRGREKELAAEVFGVEVDQLPGKVEVYREGFVLFFNFRDVRAYDLVYGGEGGRLTNGFASPSSGIPGLEGCICAGRNSSGKGLEIIIDHEVRHQENKLFFSSRDSAMRNSRSLPSREEFPYYQLVRAKDEILAYLRDGNNNYQFVVERLTMDGGIYDYYKIAKKSAKRDLDTAIESGDSVRIAEAREKVRQIENEWRDHCNEVRRLTDIAFEIGVEHVEILTITDIKYWDRLRVRKIGKRTVIDELSLQEAVVEPLREVGRSYVEFARTLVTDLKAGRISSVRFLEAARKHMTNIHEMVVEWRRKLLHGMGNYDILIKCNEILEMITGGASDILGELITHIEAGKPLSEFLDVLDAHNGNVFDGGYAVEGLSPMQASSNRRSSKSDADSIEGYSH